MDLNRSLKRKRNETAQKCLFFGMLRCPGERNSRAESRDSTIRAGKLLCRFRTTVPWLDALLDKGRPHKGACKGTPIVA